MSRLKCPLKYVLKVEMSFRIIRLIQSDDVCPISGGVKYPKAVLDRGQQGGAGLRGEDEEVPLLRELHGHHHLGHLQGRLRIGEHHPALIINVLNIQTPEG